jgi:hypothetical protein
VIWPARVTTTQPSRVECVICILPTSHAAEPHDHE